MNVVGIIPARYHSTRFPGKVLADIAGRPMIQWVYERARRSAMLTALYVATDDERVVEAVTAFGGRVLMTRKEHPSGSDRIAEVVERLEQRADWVVNIQGDEPLIDPEAIDLAINVALSDSRVQVSTLATRIRNAGDLDDPNVVKVALAPDHTALYFSRSPIPFCRDVADKREWLARFLYLQHIGVYVYQTDLLLQFVKWPPGRLEMTEKLEQLRLLERKIPIHVALTEYSGPNVDTPAELDSLVRSLENH